MFFIMGAGQNSKQLEYNQLVMCKNCQRYGQIHIFMTYSYMSFFFIPLFKWNKRYFAKMNCCNASCEISRELGREIEKGNITFINEDELHITNSQEIWKTCGNCGYTTKENFDYCPKCGRPL